jgi:trehalose/maltose transport system substrate-binding protein
VGTISPPGVTTYSEEEGRQLFQAGNALFMRNWPYAYALANDQASAVQGKFNVAQLPRGKAGHASTLGGWQLAVSKYSKHRAEAIELVRFLTSAHAQKVRAMGASLLPVRTSLYSDPEIIKVIPFLPGMKQTFEQAVARPSAATGADYNEVSTYYYEAVHSILSGHQTSSEALSDLNKLLRKVLQK